MHVSGSKASTTQLPTVPCLLPPGDLWGLQMPRSSWGAKLFSESPRGSFSASEFPVCPLFSHLPPSLYRKCPTGRGYTSGEKHNIGPSYLTPPQGQCSHLPKPPALLSSIWKASCSSELKLGLCDPGMRTHLLAKPIVSVAMQNRPPEETPPCGNPDHLASTLWLLRVILNGGGLDLLLPFQAGAQVPHC